MCAYPPPVTESLLQEITQRIVAAFQLQKVILFGSRASGTARDDSDVDLLVIMDATGSPVQRALQVKRACRPRFVSMDVLVKTPEEVAARLREGNLFLHKILEHGRTLYEHPA